MESICPECKKEIKKNDKTRYDEVLYLLFHLNCYANRVNRSNGKIMCKSCNGTGENKSKVTQEEIRVINSPCRVCKGIGYL